MRANREHYINQNYDSAVLCCSFDVGSKGDGSQECNHSGIMLWIDNSCLHMGLMWSVEKENWRMNNHAGCCTP